MEICPAASVARSPRGIRGIKKRQGHVALGLSIQFLGEEVMPLRSG